MVADTPENCYAVIHNLPFFRDPDFDASENGVCFQNRLPASDLGVPQVDLAASENRGALGVMEILCRNVTVHTAEHRHIAPVGMIHKINEGQQGDQADEDARATRRPRSGGGGRTRSAGRGWLHVNLPNVKCIATRARKAPGFRWTALCHR